MVQQPRHILAMAGLYLLVWAALRWVPSWEVRQADALLAPAAGWLVYAAWEWLVLAKTPEADIRVDLLLIWPLLALLTLWAIVRIWRAWPG